MLLLPGPTDIPDESYQAMTLKIVNHRGEQFRELHKELLLKLKEVLRTSGDVFVLTCSATGAVEAAVANVVDRNDSVLVFRNGQFAERMGLAAETYSDKVSYYDLNWGTAPTLSDLKAALDKAGDVDVVLLVHNETSTGAFAPDLKSIADECKSRGIYLVVDAVTSVGGVEVFMDELGVDVLITGTQKCLAGPPGLSIIALKDSVWDKIASKKKRPFYFDLILHKKFLEKWETPFTPAISLIYGLNASLSYILKIGLSEWIERHKKGAMAFYHALDVMGLEAYPAPEFRSRTLIAVKTPNGIKDSDVAALMVKRHDVHIGVGVAREKGKVLRIGNMGLVSPERIYKTIIALGESLNVLGFKSNYERAAEDVWNFFK